MKKLVVLIVILILVLVATGLWIFSINAGMDLMEIVSGGIIFLLVGFALIAGFKRWSSLKRGEPAEDEMSKSVMRKTAALSYYLSIYWWLVVMYFSDRVKYETQTVIGAGILGMAVVFVVSWVVFNFTGERNE